MSSDTIRKYIGSYNIIRYGTILIIIGSISMFTVALIFNAAPYLTSITMTIHAIGVAISYPIVFARSLEFFPDINGTASSLIMSIRSLICSILIIISSYLSYGRLWTIAMMLLLSVIIITVILYNLLQLEVFKKNYIESDSLRCGY